MSKTTILRSSGSRARTSSALSSCSSSSTNSTPVRESSHRGTRTCDARIGRIDAVRDAAAASTRQVGEHPFDDGVRRGSRRIRPARSRARSGRLRSRAPPAPSASQVQRARCRASSGASRPASPRWRRRSRTSPEWCRRRARRRPAGGGVRSQRLLMRLLIASLLLLPAPLAAHAGFLHAEVELLDVVLLAQPRAGVFHHDAAVLEHVAVVGDVERHVGVLLDQQDGRAALAVDAHHDLEDLLASAWATGPGSARRAGSASGAAISAREIASICCWPPESSPASCCARSRRIGK